MLDELGYRILSQAVVWALAWTSPSVRLPLLAYSGGVWCAEAWVASQQDPGSSFCDPPSSGGKTWFERLAEALGYSTSSCSQTFYLPAGRLLGFLGLVPQSSPLNVANHYLGFLLYTALLAHGVVGLYPAAPAGLRLLLGVVGQAGVLLSVPVTAVLFWELRKASNFCPICLMLYAVNAQIWLAAAL